MAKLLVMSFDSSLSPPALLWCCQYVKGTKQILIAVCVVEFSALHSHFLVCKLLFIVLFCKCVYSFSVFFTKLFWQPQLLKLFCKNYRFFLQCSNQTGLFSYTLVISINKIHYWFSSGLMKWVFFKSWRLLENRSLRCSERSSDRCLAWICPAGTRRLCNVRQTLHFGWKWKSG